MVARRALGIAGECGARALIEQGNGGHRNRLLAAHPARGNGRRCTRGLGAVGRREADGGHVEVSERLGEVASIQAMKLA
jgi:hypothetical protein